MAMKWMAPSIAASGGEDLLYEAGELGFAHLASRHGEVAMADLSEPADMSIDLHIAGRVGEDQLRAFAVEKARIGVRAGRVGADQPVRPDLPDVAGPRDRRASDLRHGGRPGSALLHCCLSWQSLFEAPLTSACLFR